VDSNGVDVLELEEKIYDFVAGVLPIATIPTDLRLGYSVRLLGANLQKNSIDVTNEAFKHCWIEMQSMTYIYRFPDGAPPGVTQVETEFMYTITLEVAKSILPTVTIMNDAMRLLTHREGYELFVIIGLMDFNMRSSFMRRVQPPTNYSMGVHPVNNNSVYTVDLILRFRCIINVPDIKLNNPISSVGITVYNEKKEEIYNLSESNAADRKRR
jgi:hypothetical protein